VDVARTLLPFASPKRLMQVAETSDKLNISNFFASVDE
jgi:hypothetical protein